MQTNHGLKIRGIRPDCADEKQVWENSRCRTAWNPREKFPVLEKSGKFFSARKRSRRWNFECAQVDRSHFPWRCNLLRFWEAELRGGGGAGGDMNDDDPSDGAGVTYAIDPDHQVGDCRVRKKEQSKGGGYPEPGYADRTFTNDVGPCGDTRQTRSYGWKSY